MDRISELPRDILQRILYFLSQEEAVRTSVLSKSWRYNWCTRRNVDFSYTSFNRKEGKYISVVDKTLHRYRGRRLCVEEFSLSILSDYLYDESKLVLLLEKWIPLLITTMGLNKFGLSIMSNYRPQDFKLSAVVVESLQDLHLECFKLDEETIGSILPCKHLRSLYLEGVCIEDDILQKIISSYPLIETLKVDGNCQRLGTIKLNDLHNLKHFFLRVYGGRERERDADEQLSSIEIYPLSLETLYIDFSFYIDVYDSSVWFDKGADFRNLKRLNLECVKSSLEHLSWCKFPSLERLILDVCAGLEGIQQFIDAPNIKYFHYRGDFIPCISFPTTSREWKSDISITYISTNDGSWFLKLNELLKSLSNSKISLRISHSKLDVIRETIPVQENGYDKPVAVESLDFRCYLSSLSCLVSGVFVICRPRNICSYPHGGDMRIVGCLWKILMERECGKVNQFAQLLMEREYGKIDKSAQLTLLRDLEEVNFEMKEVDQEKLLLRDSEEVNLEVDQEGRRQATLSDFLLNYVKGGRFKFRFALKWSERLYVSPELH